MITIYWGVNTEINPEGIRAEAPINILQNIAQGKSGPAAPHPGPHRDGAATDELLKGTQDVYRPQVGVENLGRMYTRCPAFIDELENLYGIKSYFDYTVQWGVEGQPPVSSPDYSVDFFDTHFLIRSLAENLYDFHQHFYFFTEEPSLEMSLLPPYFEDNSIANNTITIPGKVDIGKYFRAMSYAFLLKQNCDEIRFNRKEIMMYFKFHTTEKIKFKRFLFTKELNMNDALMMSAKDFKYDIATKLKYYYNIFEKSNLKKKQLKLIKENLCKDE